MLKQDGEKSAQEVATEIIKFLRGKSYYFTNAVIEQLKIRLDMECFIPLTFPDDDKLYKEIE